MLLWITDRLRSPVIAFVSAFGLQLCGLWFLFLPLVRCHLVIPFIAAGQLWVFATYFLSLVLVVWAY